MRARLLLVGVGVVLAMAVTEGGLRALDLFAPPPPVPVPRRPDLYQPHGVLGYTLKPSTSLSYEYPLRSGRRIGLRSNADGFRNSREIDSPDARPRIWFLGDSMTLGEGVEEESRFTNVLERLEPGWRIDNLAMTGWGLDLMVRAFEFVAPRAKSDLVVLAMYTDDFRRLQPNYSGQGYAFPKFTLDDGHLVDRPFPAPLAAWRRLRSVQAIEQSYWRFNRNRYDLNFALMDRLKQLVGPSGLAVLFLPGRGDTAEDQDRRRRLAEWSQAAAVPFFDLTEVIHRVRADEVYLPDNPHWNERGHALAAEAVQSFLRELRFSR